MLFFSFVNIFVWTPPEQCLLLSDVSLGDIVILFYLFSGFLIYTHIYSYHDLEENTKENNGYLKGYKNLALQWTDDYHDYRNDSLSAGFVALAVFVFVRGVGGGIL